jgi:hypothetical protein
MLFEAEHWEWLGVSAKMPWAHQIFFLICPPNPICLQYTEEVSNLLSQSSSEMSKTKIFSVGNWGQAWSEMHRNHNEQNQQIQGARDGRSILQWQLGAYDLEAGARGMLYPVLTQVHIPIHLPTMLHSGLPVCWSWSPDKACHESTHVDSDPYCEYSYYQTWYLDPLLQGWSPGW